MERQMDRVDRAVVDGEDVRTISEMFGGMQTKSMVIRITSEDYSAIQQIALRKETIVTMIRRGLKLK